MLTDIRYASTEDAEVGGVRALGVLCAELASASLDTGVLPADTALSRLRILAESSAREGRSMQDALQAVHGAGASVLRARALATVGVEVVDHAVFMFQVVDVLGGAVSGVYLGRCIPESGHRDRLRRLTESMLAGDAQAHGLAVNAGVDPASSFDVVSVMFVDEAQELRPRRKALLEQGFLDRASNALASDSTGLLISLNTRGGAVLVSEHSPLSADCVVDRIRASLGVDVVAASVRAVFDDVPSAAQHARELLDLAWGLNLSPRVFTTADLALEYQLTRPGAGRARLRAMVRPLDGTPELLHTLRTFISLEANRRASAKALYVHPNTVDYRLKRIEALTGIDPLSSAGLVTLHAALVVDSLEVSEGSRAPVVGGDVAAAS